ncbi:MAG TPA: enolase C-terminal domain-like protein [Verrucomicrobiae bacterium]|nr:enolase C-terminal domain-like protein [Verrucomicrobiae bacterium]
MTKPTDIRVVGVRLYFLPIRTRMPLKFGTQTSTSVTCARCALQVVDRQGRKTVGWGETPLSVQWVWPSSVPYEVRHDALKQFTIRLAESWAKYSEYGHPMEVGYDFQEQVLPGLLDKFNAERGAEPMPWLGALVACSLFDVALHDAYGEGLGRPVYETYGPEFMNRDLAAFLEPASGVAADFAGRFPAHFLTASPPSRLLAWHLVGGLDPIEASDCTGNEPADGYPVTLRDWVRRDGLKCLKIKLRGNDPDWDYQRLLKVGALAVEEQVNWLTADFNCTVADPAYVNEMLDRLRDEHPRLYGMTLYIEQPFPYELERHRIDVHTVSARKPLFLDESAHDWRHVRLGRELGWTGVALKTCKTQTGALLSACWSKAHGMTLMVQDLTNPMLAQIPHLSLAARVGTIMGVETNAAQFYPEASRDEAQVHPGLYERREGRVDLSTLGKTGFGYRIHEIHRTLPPPAAEFA